MRMPICQFLFDYEGLPVEEFEEEGGLSCESVWRMQGIMNALYEYLCDRAVPGADEPSLPGHRHGRALYDGSYINRNGSAAAAWLPPQASGAASAAAYFEALDAAMPQNGAESGAAGLSVNALCFYCRKDYLALSYLCRARCSLPAGVGFVRLEIRDSAGLLLTSDECAVTGEGWQGCLMICELPDDERCEGWLQMTIKYGLNSGGGLIELRNGDRWSSGGHGAAAEILLH